MDTPDKISRQSGRSAAGPEQPSLELLRMRISYEQMLISWIGTATSLIAFGFTIYKFFQLEAPRGPVQKRLLGAREFAFILVTIGLLSLTLAAFQYRQHVRLLGAQATDNVRSVALVSATLISLLGIVALLAMIFRE